MPELNGSPKKEVVTPMGATDGSDSATPARKRRFADFHPTPDLDEGH